MEVYAYVDGTERAKFLVIQQDVVHALIDLVRRSGTDFASPSSTIYLSKGAAAAPTNS